MSINAWMAKHKDDDNFVDRETGEILSGRPNSTVAAKLWMAIARGEAGVAETLMWAQTVAKRIKADLIDESGQASSDRERAALRAIGFFGRVDAYREAKEYMSLISMFSPLGVGGVSQSYCQPCCQVA
jgi:hypothetical protein